MLLLMYMVSACVVIDTGWVNCCEPLDPVGKTERDESTDIAHSDEADSPFIDLTAACEVPFEQQDEDFSL